MKRILASAVLGVATALAGCVADPVAPPAAFAPLLDRELAAVANDPARPIASLAVLAIRGGDFSAPLFIDVHPAAEFANVAALYAGSRERGAGRN